MSQNLVNGTGAPTRNSTTNNANLPLGSGARFIGAGTSTISSSQHRRQRLRRPEPGARRHDAAATGPLSAENNWWGLRFTAVTNNVGPAISPTTNPPVPENPVNGAPVAGRDVRFDRTAPLSTTRPRSTSARTATASRAIRTPASGRSSTLRSRSRTRGRAVDVEADAATYEPGDTVTLSATASDDFGIANVTFFDGANALSIDEQPPYGATFVIPANGALRRPHLHRDLEGLLGPDRIGQRHRHGRRRVRLRGPAGSADDLLRSARPRPPSPAPALTYSVTAASESGVDQVEFFLGTRSVCVDDTAPYTCNVLPNGDEVGDQILSAVVTSTDEQTATAATAGDGPEVRAEPDARDVQAAPLEEEASSGRSQARSSCRRASTTTACTGTVTLNIQRDGITLFPSSQVDVQPDCTYSLTFTIKEKKKKGKPKPTYDVGASFSGNGTLNPVSKSRCSVHDPPLRQDSDSKVGK